MTDLQLDDRDGVRTITIDRPASRNGLTTELCDRIAAAVRGVPGEVRVIVLTGASGAFCSGLDLKDAMQRGITAGPEIERGLRESFHGVIRALVESDRPTIAVVDGAAAGFGCDLALACDLRVASDRGVFGEIFVRRGLMPDGGGTWHLPRIVGLGRALELLLTGELVNAEDALRIGLANRVVPDAAAAVAMAQDWALRLSRGPTFAHAMTKQMIESEHTMALGEAIEAEAQAQALCMQHPDFAEAHASFKEKRPARFRGAPE
jgi:enoyl-CoA hydratase/carnithine racemase